jgi:hypothetical protein
LTRIVFLELYPSGELDEFLALCRRKHLNEGRSAGFLELYPCGELKFPGVIFCPYRRKHLHRSESSGGQMVGGAITILISRQYCYADSNSIQYFDFCIFYNSTYIKETFPLL